MTERQEKILHKIIEFYTGSGEPVASGVLHDRGGFEISPATMRAEMNALEEEGFLEQPHISSGRVPTDKAYRQYVNKTILEKGSEKNQNELGAPDRRLLELTKPALQYDDNFRMMHELTKQLSDMTSCLAMTYFDEGGLLFKEGWDEIMKLHEFEQANTMRQFTSMIEDLESEMRQMEKEMTADCDEVMLKIGREIGFDKSGEFSLMAIGCKMPNSNKKMTIALAGPKRASYKKNLSLIKSAKKIVEKKIKT